MSTFKISLRQTIERMMVGKVQVTRAEVIRYYDLQGEDRDDWRDYVGNYIADEVDLDVTDIRPDPAHEDHTVEIEYAGLVE